MGTVASLLLSRTACAISGWAPGEGAGTLALATLVTWSIGHVGSHQVASLSAWEQLTHQRKNMARTLPPAYPHPLFVFTNISAWFLPVTRKVRQCHTVYIYLALDVDEG